jgi:hypothetical protein
MSAAEKSWVGPFRLREYLEKSVDDDQAWPPQRGGVYVVSSLVWRGQPSTTDDLLYVGGNTGESDRFITRIGDLIADMLGFWGDQTGHHSGGIRLWEYCRENRINPLDLFLGWQVERPCVRCAEYDLFVALAPKLNRKRPARCSVHQK